MATLAAARQIATQRVRGGSRWHAVIRAMSQTGGASILSGLLTMGATKVIAVMLGPAQIALLATLQQLRNSAVSAATFNGQTALVQGASSTEGRARREFLRTSGLLIAAATVAVVTTFLTAPEWVANLVGLDASKASLIRWLSIPVTLSGGYVFLASILNALGAIGTLAKLQVAAPAAMLLLSYPAAIQVAAGNDLLLVALLSAASGSATGFAAFALFCRRAEAAHWFSGEGHWWTRQHASRFFAISGSMLISGLVASGALLALRARILRTDGLLAGGQFDAAWAISMNHVTLILASMQTYYLPTLARTVDPQERQAHIRRVLTVAVIGAAILIATMAALKPWIIQTLYAEAFSESARYLRWTLIGDYLKVTSWILSIPLVAMAQMKTFLTADLIAYATFLAGGFLLTQWASTAEATAQAFVAMYAVHMAVCAAFLWKRGEFRPDLKTIGVWTAGLVLVLASSALHWSVD